MGSQSEISSLLKGIIGKRVRSIAIILKGFWTVRAIFQDIFSQHVKSNKLAEWCSDFVNFGDYFLQKTSNYLKLVIQRRNRHQIACE